MLNKSASRAKNSGELPRVRAKNSGEHYRATMALLFKFTLIIVSMWATAIIRIFLTLQEQIFQFQSELTRGLFFLLRVTATLLRL